MQTPHTQSFAQAIAQPQETLIFRLADQFFGLPILAIQELCFYTPPTARLALSRPEALGILNLRGELVPLVDTRQLAGLPTQPPGPSSVVVVVRHERRLCGLLVDAVLDVVALEASQIRQSPLRPSSADSAASAGGERISITGMATLQRDHAGQEGHPDQASALVCLLEPAALWG